MRAAVSAVSVFVILLGQAAGGRLAAAGSVDVAGMAGVSVGQLLPQRAGTTSHSTVLDGSAVTSSVSSPSGEPMPVGDLPGWKQNLAQDFTTPATSATFDKTYASSWCGYADGTGGKYFKSTVSAYNGMQVFTLDGTRGAAGSYGPPATCWGRVYGRYSIRFKATGAMDEGTAMMLWPSSNIWGDGEIDYPEGNFNGHIEIHHHGMGCTNCRAADSLDTGAGWHVWHTATTEWVPGSVRYYLDGTLVKTVTHDIPVTNHRWTLQVAPNGANPKPGRLMIDWVASWTPTTVRHAPRLVAW